VKEIVMPARVVSLEMDSDQEIAIGLAVDVVRDPKTLSPVCQLAEDEHQHLTLVVVDTPAMRDMFAFGARVQLVVRGGGS
jgi:hypothetical protein